VEACPVAVISGIKATTWWYEKEYAVSMEEQVDHDEQVLWVRSGVTRETSAEDQGIQHRLWCWIVGNMGLTQGEIAHLMGEMVARGIAVPETDEKRKAEHLDDVESWRDEASRMLSLLEGDIAELKVDLRRGGVEQAIEDSSMLTGRADYVQDYVWRWKRAEEGQGEEVAKLNGVVAVEWLDAPEEGAGQ